MSKFIYFDHASTTKPHEDVVKQYTTLLTNHFANSESLYSIGVNVKELLIKSKKYISSTFNVQENEVIFTSGASESNNLAIKGLLNLWPNRKHIITSKVEHSSVLDVYKYLEEYQGYDVTYLNVNASGQVRIEELRNALRDDTLLVSIMWVNNEVGAINNIDEIKKILKQYHRTYLHVDAVQALGKINIDVKDIDLMSISAHKIMGLKGSGILIKKNHVNLHPQIIAGQQEYGLRGGTTNALAHIMFAKTLRIALEDMNKYHEFKKELISYLVEKLNNIKEVEFNSKDYTCGIINFSTNIKSEVMLNALNAKNICVSALSTCHSNKISSHVLEAMNLSHDRITSSIRVSINYTNNKEEIDYFIETIKEIINKYGKY